jgi:hypothetical protein
MKTYILSQVLNRFSPRITGLISSVFAFFVFFRG